MDGEGRGVGRWGRGNEEGGLVWVMSCEVKMYRCRRSGEKFGEGAGSSER